MASTSVSSESTAQTTSGDASMPVIDGVELDRNPGLLVDPRPPPATTSFCHRDPEIPESELGERGLDGIQAFSLTRRSMSAETRTSEGP